MKRMAVLLVFSLVLLAGSFSLFAYDNSANVWKVLPECIWASATGGGTWMTEVQITSMASTAATINVTFFYGGGLKRGPFPLVTTALAQYHTVKYSNILQTIDGLDADAFTYYGKVGAVWFNTISPDSAIHATAKTKNGNYGKTFPGLNIVESNTAAQGRIMVIPLLVNNATYRTFTGFFNTSATATYTMTFYVTNSVYAFVGTTFTKTLVPFDYLAFNPFVEAGVGAGTYDNYYLLIWPTAGGSDVRGVMCYGAIANNITQDPSALLAYPWHVSPWPAPLESLNP